MINCIAIDDEPLALELIKSHVKRLGTINLSATFTDAFKAYNYMQKENVDLIFLDIQMPDISGIEFLKSLKTPPMVIFTTAYHKYAIDGFDLDVIDYLLKPFEFQRFLKATNKAIEYFELRNKGDMQKGKDYLFVKADYRLVKINFSEIQYIEGLDDYIKIYNGETKPILTLMSLKDILTRLPSEKFIRVHRSYIVSIDKISSITKSRIKVGEKEIPIGDTYSGVIEKLHTE